MPTVDTPRFRDPSLSAEERARDLLARMTIDEKLAQLGALWSFVFVDNRAPGKFPVQRCRDRLMPVVDFTASTTPPAGARDLM